MRDDEFLLRKNSIKIKGIANPSQRTIIKDEISTVIKQYPNTYFIGIPYKVGLYNMRYNFYEKNPNHYQIRSRFVERPIILDTALTHTSVDNIRGYLQNMGYFSPEVKANILYTKKKAKVVYEINSGKNYYINNIDINCEDSTISRIINNNFKNSKLQKNTPYTNIKVSEERGRLVNLLKNWGYYNLGTTNISFELDTLPSIIIHRDTLNKNYPIDISIHVNNNKAQNSFKVFHFNKINVYLDHEEFRDINTYHTVTINGINYHYIDKKYLNYNILDQKITLRPNQVSSLENYNQTLKLLNELEILQLIRININQNIEKENRLDIDIILSPNKKYDFSTNLEVSGGEMYTLGSALKLSFINKNLFKGANKLSITGSYGIESNIDDSDPSLNFLQKFYLFSQNIGLNFNLTFPKFIHPFPNKTFSRTMVPKSYLEGGINQLARTDYFGLRSINAGWGYRWRASTYEQWGIKPFAVNILNLYKVSDIFQQRMDSIPAIRNSYQETFIEGETFEYVYNSELKNPNKFSILKFAIEEGGLLMNGLSHTYTTLNKNAQPLKFAEFVRLDFDLRHFIKSQNSSWAFRFYGGIGVPYNKATSLPYIKQYFVGGAYSIRGWRPRVLGPGSYNALKNNENNYLFVDQAGDIKLEWNGEYRFPIITIWGGGISINGALFVDAGNIWLMKSVENMPGAEFKFNKLYKDLAASYGIGFRFDLGGFLVVRTDFAFQAKKPYETQNDGWTIQHTQFGNSSWRQENMNFNIAIGYPF